MKNGKVEICIRDRRYINHNSCPRLGVLCLKSLKPSTVGIPGELRMYLKNGCEGSSARGREFFLKQEKRKKRVPLAIPDPSLFSENIPYIFARKHTSLPAAPKHLFFKHLWSTYYGPDLQMEPDRDESHTTPILKETQTS